MGINYYIFISAIVFGLGLITVISARDAIRAITGIIMLFTASAINIAAFTGFMRSGTDGKIILLLITAACVLQIGFGILLMIQNYRLNKDHSLTDVDNYSGDDNE